MPCRHSTGAIHLLDNVTQGETARSIHKVKHRLCGDHSQETIQKAQREKRGETRTMREKGRRQAREKREMRSKMRRMGEEKKGKDKERGPEKQNQKKNN